jgi:D-arabinose 1-dehydrogenase-like Zn-dependent alcohol dehydrogenase
MYRTGRWARLEGEPRGKEQLLKAIVIREFGGPEILRWEDVPTPVPGPGEVLVRVHAVSVNRTLDLQVRQDGGNYGVTLPLVMGNDPSGIVVGVGPGVDLAKVNDRVAIFGGVGCGSCQHCTDGNQGRCTRRRMLGVQCWDRLTDRDCRSATAAGDHSSTG